MKLHVAPVQHLQEDPEQVAADEAAAAKCLGLSPYWLKIELDATSGRRSIEVNLKLHFKFHNIEHQELQSSISLGL